MDFDDALALAQQLGYAERNPAADIEGHDACRKICILAAIAFGEHVYPQQVPTEGIRGVTLEDVAYADSCGCKIKLLGRAIRQPEGKVCVYVFVYGDIKERCDVEREGYDKVLRLAQLRSIADTQTDAEVVRKARKRLAMLLYDVNDDKKKTGDFLFVIDIQPFFKAVRFP